MQTSFIKKIPFVFLFLFVNTLCAVAGKTEDFTVGNVAYAIESFDNRTCRVVRPGMQVASVVIPKTVNYNGATFKVVGIAPRAYYRAYELEAVAIEADIDTIPAELFYDCNKLTIVKLPNTIKYIEESAFAACTQLKKFTFPPELIQIKAGAFYSAGLTGEIKLPKKLRYIGANAFGSSLYENQYEKIIIPASCTYIGAGAINSKKVQEVIIEDSEKAISVGEDAFGDFQAGKKNRIYIGRPIVYASMNDKKTITDYASLFNFDIIVFGDLARDCPAFTNPNSTFMPEVKELRLGYMTVPQSNIVTFSKIYVTNPSPTSNVAAGETLFTSRTYANCTLYVPTGSKNAYQSAEHWKNFLRIEEYTPTESKALKEYREKQAREKAREERERYEQTHQASKVVFLERRLYVPGRENVVKDTLYIDGKLISTFRGNYSCILNYGVHTIIMIATGCYPDTTKIVVPGDGKEIHFRGPTSRPYATSLAINTEPAGAKVMLKSPYYVKYPALTTPCTFKDVQVDNSKEYEITIQLAGYKTVQQKIKISQRDTLYTLETQLEDLHKPGDISLDEFKKFLDHPGGIESLKWSDKTNKIIGKLKKQYEVIGIWTRIQDGRIKKDIEVNTGKQFMGGKIYVSFYSDRFHSNWRYKIKYSTQDNKWDRDCAQALVADMEKLGYKFTKNEKKGEYMWDKNCSHAEKVIIGSSIMIRLR